MFVLLLCQGYMNILIHSDNFTEMLKAGIFDFALVQKLFPVFQRRAFHFFFKAFAVITAAAEARLLGYVRNIQFCCGEKLYTLPDPVINKIPDWGGVEDSLKDTAAFPPADMGRIGNICEGYFIHIIVVNVVLEGFYPLLFGKGYACP